MRLLSVGMLIPRFMAMKAMKATKAAPKAASAPKMYSGRANRLLTVTDETVVGVAPEPPTSWALGN